MKKFQVKYEDKFFAIKSKTVKGNDSQDALNKFKSWALDQTVDPYRAILSVTEAKPSSFRSQVEAAYKDLGLIKCRGAVSGKTYWE